MNSIRRRRGSTKKRTSTAAEGGFQHEGERIKVKGSGNRISKAPQMAADDEAEDEAQFAEAIAASAASIRPSAARGARVPPTAAAAASLAALTAPRRVLWTCLA
jgi:hypothetical protein